MTDTFDRFVPIQNAIGYIFKSLGILETALTAAGVEELHHDGNRSPAQLGDAFLRFSLVNEGHEERVPRCMPIGRVDIWRYSNISQQR